VLVMLVVLVMLHYGWYLDWASVETWWDAAEMMVIFLWFY